MAGNSLELALELPRKKDKLDLTPTGQSKASQPSAADQPPAMNPEQAYKQWSQDRTPEQGAALLQSLNPYISAAANRHTGSASPVTMSKARSMMIDALPRYDGRSSLNTFVDRQLLPLRRWNAKQRVGVKIPRSLVQQQQALNRAEDELSDKLDRLPSRAELADYTGINLKTIAKVTSSHVPVAGERQFESADGQMGSAEDQAIEQDGQLTQQMVYYSLAPVNQFIMEHTLGLNGASPLSNQRLAKHLKISPSAVSQRKAMIQRLLDEGN